MIAYRIHNPDEPLDALLDPLRPDGWVASDESQETQPLGVSACASIADLMDYAREYSMAVVPGALLVELEGDRGGDDRDRYAVRVVVRRYRVIGRGDRLVRAATSSDGGRRRVIPGRGART